MRLSALLETTLLALAVLTTPVLARAGARKAMAAADAPVRPEWHSDHAQVLAGLPGARNGERGTLEIDGTSLIFAGKTGRAVVALSGVYAVGAGDERVELWGTPGKLLRMGMPNGAGLFAATFMHHRVDMLTVEFADGTGGYHAAVFLLPAEEAAQAAQTVAAMPVAHRQPREAACTAGVQPGTVRVLLPEWRGVEAPAAYRGLLYERVLERLARTGGLGHVYREGEPIESGRCQQYTVTLTASAFKPGNQVVRAATGPVGLFVAKTQMGFDLRVVDDRDRVVVSRPVKGAARGDTESIKVADVVAKKVAKQFAEAWKRDRQPGGGTAPGR